VLLAYLDYVRDKFADAHRFNLLLWRIGTAFSGGDKPPRLPDILKEQPGNGEQ
jgi:hypothetical protein